MAVKLMFRYHHEAHFTMFDNGMGKAIFESCFISVYLRYSLWNLWVLPVMFAVSGVVGAWCLAKIGAEVLWENQW